MERLKYEVNEILAVAGSGPTGFPVAQQRATGMMGMWAASLAGMVVVGPMPSAVSLSRAVKQWQA